MIPLVLAHRGACWEAPENTLEAFELAIAEQADYVEFDVRARGGDLVICHDPGPPKDVPLLDDVLRALTGRIGLCVEIKEPETADAVLDALERHRAEPEETMVVSFHRGALETVRRRRPELRCAFHVPGNDPRGAEGLWGAGLEEPVEDVSIRGAQELGLASLVFTVNDPERMQQLGRLDVTGLFTDRPALARQVLLAAR